MRGHSSNRAGFAEPCGLFFISACKSGDLESDGDAHNDQDKSHKPLFYGLVAILVAGTRFELVTSRL